MTELPATATMVAFAKLHGVSRAAAYKWKRRGYIVFTVDGKVNVAESNRRLSERPDVFRGGVTKSARPSPAQLIEAPDWSLAESTRRRQAAMAQLAELELSLKSGKLLERDKAFACVEGVMRGVRQFVLSIPGAAAFSIPTLSSTDRGILERICSDGLTDCSMERGYDFGGKGGRISDEDEKDG
jgi:hypothetical protein